MSVSSPRISIELRGGFRFRWGDASPGVEAAAYDDVALDAGENRIEVEGRRATATVRDECCWTVL